MENNEKELEPNLNTEEKIISDAYAEANNKLLLDEQRRLRREKTYQKSARVLKKENNIIIAIISFCVALIVGAIGFLTYTIIRAENYINFSYSVNNELVSMKFKNSTYISQVIPPFVTGYEFDGWYRDASLTIKVPDNYIISSDTFLYPKYNSRKYSVVFNSNNYDNKSVKLDVKYNDYYATIDNPFVYDNYNFIGWSLDKNATSKDDIVNEKEKLILSETSTQYYAIWEGVESTLTFNLDNMFVDGIPYFVDDKTTKLGSKVQLPNINGEITNALNSDYHFVAFKYNGNYYNPGEFITISDINSNVDVVWSNAKSTLMLNINLPYKGVYTEYYTSMMVSNLENRNKFSLPNLENLDNYIFEGWNTVSDGSGIKYFANANFESDSESNILYAMWKPVTKSIVLVNELADTTQIISIDYSTSKFIPTPISDKYEFKGWRLYKWSEDSVYIAFDDDYVSMGGYFTCDFEEESLLLFAHWERITSNIKIRNIDTLAKYSCDDYKHNIYEELNVEALIDYCTLHLSKDGYSIVGFTTDFNLRDVVMDNIYIDEQDIVLYPVWQKN